MANTLLQCNPRLWKRYEKKIASVTRPGNPNSGALWLRAGESHSLSQPTKDVPDVSAPPAVRVSKAAGVKPHRSSRSSQALLPGRTDDSQQLGADQVASNQRVRQAVVISNQVCQLHLKILVVNLSWTWVLVSFNRWKYNFFEYRF